MSNTIFDVSDQELVTELKRRAKCHERKVCHWCDKPVDQPGCAYSEHHRIVTNSPIDALLNEAVDSQRAWKRVELLENRIQRARIIFK